MRSVSDRISIQGSVDIIIFDKQRIYYDVHQKNLVTQLGKQFFGSKIASNGLSSVFVSAIGFGDGTTQPNLNNTELENETFLLTSLLTTSDSNKAIFTGLVSDQQDLVDVTELGLFTNEDPKRLVCRILLNNPFNKPLGQFLSITWNIQVA